MSEFDRSKPGVISTPQTFEAANIKKGNVTTTDPTATDDASAGYAVLSRWLNTATRKEFLCVDATPGFAIWIEGGGGGGGVATIQDAFDGSILAGSVPVLDTGGADLDVRDTNVVGQYNKVFATSNGIDPSYQITSATSPYNIIEDDQYIYLSCFDRIDRIRKSDGDVISWNEFAGYGQICFYGTDYLLAVLDSGVTERMFVIQKSNMSSTGVVYPSGTFGQSLGGIAHDGTYFYGIAGDSGEGRVLRGEFGVYNVQGTIFDVSGLPEGIASMVYHDGELLACSPATNVLYRIDIATWAVTQAYGSTGSGDNQFDDPADLKIISDTLRIVDRGNNRVKIHALSDFSYIGEYAIPSTVLSVSNGSPVAYWGLEYVNASTVNVNHYKSFTGAYTDKVVAYEIKSVGGSSLFETGMSAPVSYRDIEANKAAVAAAFITTVNTTDDIIEGSSNFWFLASERNNLTELTAGSSTVLHTHSTDILVNDSEALGTYVSAALTGLKNSLGTVNAGSVPLSTSNLVIQSFSAASDGMCEWVYQLSQGNNVRGGTIVAFWDASAETVSFTDTSPPDIGTVLCSFSVDYSGGQVRLLATNTDGSNAYAFSVVRRNAEGQSAYAGVGNSDPAVLQRVDTQQWEEVQVGVEYFSPNQHGNRAGKVLRKYYGATGSGAVIVSNAAEILDYANVFRDGSSRYYEHGHYSDGANYMLLSQSGITGNGNITINYITFTHISGWVDYTLTTPPATRPSGQPFVDTSSPLMKRVDTGLYELPQSGVLYFAKDQSLGMGDPVLCFNTSGTGSTATDIDTPVPGGYTVKTYFGARGSLVQGADGTQIPISLPWTAGATAANYVTALGDLRIARGSDFDDADDSWNVWFYFTVNEL